MRSTSQASSPTRPHSPEEQCALLRADRPRTSASDQLDRFPHHWLAGPPCTTTAIRLDLEGHDRPSPRRPAHRGRLELPSRTWTAHQKNREKQPAVNQFDCPLLRQPVAVAGPRAHGINRIAFEAPEPPAGSTTANPWQTEPCPHRGSHDQTVAQIISRGTCNTGTSSHPRNRQSPSACARTSPSRLHTHTPYRLCLDALDRGPPRARRTHP